MKFLLCLFILFPAYAFSAEASKIRFGINAFMPPYVIVEGESFSGISVDILKSVFKKANLPYKLEALSNRRLNELFIGGDFTGVMYLSSGSVEDIPVFFGPELIPFKNGFMCIEKKYCEQASVLGNSLRMAGFQNASKVMGIKFKKLTDSMENYSEVTNQKEQIMGLFSKRFDVVFGDDRVLRYHIDHIAKSSHVYSKKVRETKFIHRPYSHQTPRPVAFANKGERDLFFKAYKELKASGEIERIIERYLND
ncbi:MAG: hypothetical protein VX642_04420 [Bdellovibrionota bacterium]|nr:hypothetical protein [Bdellovibrionota bacterium]